MLTSPATADGTACFAGRFPKFFSNAFYRTAQDLTVSALGAGSYLGAMDDVTDRAYEQALCTAIAEGVNFIDTSLNYRHQRSERAIGRALGSASVSRDQLVICSKAGYLVPGALPVGQLKAADIVGNMHCMAAAFLEDQLTRSLANLGVGCIDVFYLHNPETQLQFVDPETFYARMRLAFETLEAQAAAGRIRFYGTATWNGYRANGGPRSLSLTRLVSLAREVAGDNHRFRFIQLPFNLEMTEAFRQRPEAINGKRLSVLEAASELGITVVASASLLQAKLDPNRALPFVRSTPGITVALVGMSKAAHVRQNLEAAARPPMDPDQFAKLLS